MEKSVQQLREEFEIFCENEDFSGELSNDVYKRVLTSLKDKQSLGDKKASTALNQIISRWEGGDRIATNYAKNLQRYDIDITEL